MRGLFFCTLMGMGWCVYILECASGAYYTGSTPDLEQRFRRHQNGKGARYTRMDKPTRILAAQVCDSRSAALRLEAAVKRFTREEKRRWVAAHPYEAPAGRGARSGAAP